MNEWDGVA